MKCGSMLQLRLPLLLLLVLLLLLLLCRRRPPRRRALSSSVSLLFVIALSGACVMNVEHYFGSRNMT